MLTLLMLNTLTLLKTKNWFWKTPMMLILSSFIMLFNNFNFNYYSSFMFKLDNLSFTLILLTIWISTLMIIFSNKFYNNNNNPSILIYCLLILNLILIFTFSFKNLILFYFSFEASLIPTLILILIWGYQPERLQASFFLMIYTVISSLPLLLSLMFLSHFSSSMKFYPYFNNLIPMNFPILLSIFLILAFMVKLPIYLFHIWLPKAHVEAPLMGSMVLAAILLKLGGYGMMRISFSFPFIYKYTYMFSPFLIIGAIITSLICFRMTDLKALIAYSSVSHMGMMMASTLSFSQMGWNASIIMMIAHGLGSSLLFSLASITYDLSHSRSLILSKGLMLFIPSLSMIWFIGSMLSMGAPPFINLVAEIFITSSLVIKSHSLIFILMVILFTNAVYSLMLFTSSNHGPIMNFSNKSNFNLMNPLLGSFSHFMPALILLFNIKLMNF